MLDTSAARTALGSTNGRLATYGSLTTVELHETAPLEMLDIRLDPSETEVLREVEMHCRLHLPIMPNTATGTAGCRLLWLGPDQWLSVARDGSPQPLAPTLAACIPQHRASITDVSDLRAVFELTGPRARDTLRKGCAIDFHPRAFVLGDCASTLLARVGVLLHLIDERPSYQIFVERSYATYVWTWLTDAMIEFTCG